MAPAPSTTSQHRRPQPAASRSAASRRRDPRKPKRALSAYVFFTQVARPQIKDEHPDATFGTHAGPHGRPASESAPPPRLTPRRLILMAGELGRLLGQIWGELSDREKKPFQVLADQDKRRAERELAAYNATTDNLHSAA